MATLFIVGIIVSIILLFLAYIYSQKNKNNQQTSSVVTIKNDKSISITQNPTIKAPSTVPQNNLDLYQVDPLTTQLNNQISLAIQEQPKTTTFKVFDVSSNQTGLQTAGPLTTLQCDNASKGSFIEQLDIYSGNYVDALNIKCSNDTKTYNKVGGSGGGIQSIKSPVYGINQLSLKSGGWLDSISYNPSTSSTTQTFGGSGGGGPYIINCGPNGKLAGIKTTSGTYINQLDGICVTPVE